MATLIAAALLLTACTYGGDATPETPPVPATASVPAATQTLGMPTARPPDTPRFQVVENGGVETPCHSGHSTPDRDHQQSFLEWTPDGSSLIFDLDESRERDQSIWQIQADGSNARKAAFPLLNTKEKGNSPWGFHADVSPDGQWLVYSTCEFKEDVPGAYSNPTRIFSLALISMDGGVPKRLTEGLGIANYPQWSPDGSKIAYSWGNIRFPYGPDAVIRIASVSNTGEFSTIGQPLTDLEPAQHAPVWSPDSKHLAVIRRDPRLGWFVHVVGVADVPGSLPSIEIGPTDTAPTWSPDGERLAFAENNEEGKSASTIHIVNHDGTGRLAVPWPRGSISRMAWHPDGSEILFDSSEYTVELWTISPNGQTFRQVSQNPYFVKLPSGLEWSPDGSRIALRFSRNALLVVSTPGEEEDWRVLAVEDEDAKEGFRICNIPLQESSLPNYYSENEDCEPVMEQNP